MSDNMIFEQPALTKILSTRQVLMLTDTRSYCDNMVAEANEFKVKAEQETQQLRTELEQHQQENLEQLSRELVIANQKQLEGFIAHIESELSSILRRLMSKLQIMDFNQAQLSATIKNELIDLIKNNQIVIRCHPDSLNRLQQDLFDLMADVIYQADKSVNKEQCILECNMAVIYIDIRECRLKIAELIDNTFLVGAING